MLERNYTSIMLKKAALNARYHSVERRNSGALSAFVGSGFASDLTGSIRALSTRGVSTRAETSVRWASAGGSIRCSERGRAIARAISI